jgi:SAM-dependent methyltransferase
MNRLKEYSMSTDLSTDAFRPTRQHLHAMWSGVAPAWGTHAAFIDARGAAMTAVMLDAIAPRPGQRILELACGPGGGPGLAAAPRVGPAGEVVLSDVAPEMTALAAARVTRAGLANVRTRVLDLEDIDEPAATFDAVVVREGLMLVADPIRAASEIRRVLRPGGRVAVTVWGPRERNPWLTTAFAAVSAELGTTLPPPGVPQPFSLDDADRLAAVLSAGGLCDVTVEELPTPHRTASVDEWWARTAALAGPLARRLAALPDDVTAAIRARVGASIEPYRTPDGIEFPGVALLGSATACVADAGRSYEA